MLLQTGAWESFMRTLQIEIDCTKRSISDRVSITLLTIAGDGSVEAALLQMKLDYAVLYANSLALRSLQGKLRRRPRVGGDPAFRQTK
jgi:hypothetical protein